MKLYEISDQFRQLEELDDLPDEAIADTLEALTGEFEEKSIAVASQFKNLGSDADQLDAAIKELQARKRTIVNRQNSLKEYLRMNMERTGIKKVQHALFNITLTKPRQVVHIIDDTKLPEDYTKVVTSPDKTLILKALKDGFAVEGAELGEGQAGIRIG